MATPHSPILGHPSTSFGSYTALSPAAPSRAALAPWQNGLFARSRGGIDFDLQPTRQALAALGNPQDCFANVVIAGTNGKGSTAACLAAILKAAGKRVGLYTSPHLIHFSERMRVDGLELDGQTLDELYRAVLNAEGHSCRPLTFFEFATVMALTGFAQKSVDIAVLEVGMGGRLDATNVVNRALSVITPVSLDHQAYLGNTLQAIAGEKAGIIQHQKPLLLGPQHDAAQQVLLAAAQAAQAPVVRVAPPNASRHHSGEFLLDIALQPSRSVLLTTPHQAAFQHLAIATAVAAADILLETPNLLTDDVLQGAMRHFSWPGRYQWLVPSSLARANPAALSEPQPASQGLDVLLDAAHNADGMAALLAAMNQDPRAQRPAHGVATILADRPDALLDPLADRLQSLHLAPVQGGRGRSLQELQSIANRMPNAVAHPSLAAAVHHASEGARASQGFVVVAGSVLLMGAFLAQCTGYEPETLWAIG